MLKVIFFIFLATSSMGVLTLAWNYFQFSQSMITETGLLKAHAKAPQGVTITAEMLNGLPESAQRYFRHTGVIGTKIPRLIRLTQTGRIRASVNENWMKLEAEEVYSTSPPGFVWRAWFPSKMLPIVLGRDIYANGETGILMKMLATIPLANENGPELKPAGLVRYLNEMMWFPAAYLARNVMIGPIDANSFSVAITHNELNATAIITVDQNGNVQDFTAQRFNTTTSRVEEWHTPMTKYGTFEGLNLPIKGSADWHLEDGNFSYIELEVTNVSYEF